MNKSSNIKDKNCSDPDKEKVDIALEKEFSKIEGFDKALHNLRKRLIRSNLYLKENKTETNN